MEKKERWERKEFIRFPPPSPEGLALFNIFSSARNWNCTQLWNKLDIKQFTLIEQFHNNANLLIYQSHWQHGVNFLHICSMRMLMGIHLLFGLIHGVLFCQKMRKLMAYKYSLFRAWLNTSDDSREKNMGSL